MDDDYELDEKYIFLYDLARDLELPYSTAYNLPSWTPNWKEPALRSVHSGTEGRMFFKGGRGGGFICWDDACTYYLTIASGVRYTEV